MSGGHRDRDQMHTQPIHVEEVLEAEARNEPPPEPPPAPDPEDDDRPMQPLTVSLFVGALNRLNKTINEQTAAIRDLRAVLSGVGRTTTVNEMTLKALDEIQKNLESLSKIAYAGTATMNAVVDVRDDLRTIRSTAIASAEEMAVIREAAVSSNGHLKAIHELLERAEARAS
ncbi:MAG TPA: hypothetical protein VGG74_21345 [Kofleriaceae bacterium]|jgi:hypothetical protein